MKNLTTYFLILFSLLCAAMFGFLLNHSIKTYAEYDYDYIDLHHEQLTFIRYEVHGYYRHSISYRLYFEEYADPLVVNNITSDKLDKIALKNLEQGQKLEVYTPKNDPNDICELNTDSVTLLLLSDYNQVNRRNQTAGMIILPILILCSICAAFVFVSMLELNLPGKKARGLIMEYEADENFIRIYEAAELSSLTVNNRIIDQCRGAVGKKFHLKGSFHSKGNRCTVEAKVERMTLRLYYNGELVKTKYIVRS